MMRCPVMQLSMTVEGMDVTDHQAAGTALPISPEMLIRACLRASEVTASI